MTSSPPQGRSMMNVSPCIRHQVRGCDDPSPQEIEAAAKAWMAWQFPGRSWDDATEVMKKRFRSGAIVVLRAAASATNCKLN